MMRGMKTILVLSLTMALLAACSQQSGTEEQAAAKQQEPAAAEQQAEMPATDRLAEEAPAAQSADASAQIRGTVVKTEEGIVIFSDRGSFMVAGQDLEGLVGKNVSVIGTIEETEGKSVVNILSVSVIE